MGTPMRELPSQTAASGRQLSFFVPGEPRGKARPINYGTNIVKDEKTAAYENRIALAAHAALGDQKMFEGGVAVRIVANFQPPASTRPGPRQKMLSGDMQFIKRPDIDNLAKAVLDGCEGVVFANDRSVAELVAMKAYADRCGVHVTIIELIQA